MKTTKQHGSPVVGPALKVLAAREGRTLQRALAMQKKRQEGIHQARKACRRLRSLLLLLAEQPTQALDRDLQKLAPGLAPLRDAHIAVRTAKLLATARSHLLTPAVIHALEDRCEGIVAHALEDDPQWRRRRTEARGIIARLGKLSWDGTPAPDAKKTLKRTKRKMKKAHKEALAERTPTALHRWRRRTRKLRYQLEFLRKARRMAGIKKRYGKRIKQLTATTDQLGWRQDFQIFLDAVSQLPDTADVIALRRELKSKSARWSKSEPQV